MDFASHGLHYTLTGSSRLSGVVDQSIIFIILYDIMLTV